MKSFKQDVLKWIKSEVRVRGWSDMDLAEKMDEKPSTISNWMYSNQFPRPARIKKILTVLEIDLLKEEVFQNASIGQKLFLLRNREGLGVEESANAMATSHYLLRAWEKENKEPSGAQLRRMFRFYGVMEGDLGVELPLETFGERLLEERTLAGLTQEELGQRIFQSISMISHYENNKRIPTEAELTGMAKALMLPIDMLYTAEDGLPFPGFEALYVRRKRESRELVAR